MSVGTKPWLADRQPPPRGGVPQVTTGRVRCGSLPRSVSARPWRAPEIEVSGMARYDIVKIAACRRTACLTSRRHIDLARVHSALCSG